jgi:hypothetical protein
MATTDMTRQQLLIAGEWTGAQSSGFGRFGGRAALEEFTELRWITVQELRVTVAVTNARGRSVTFALGELDPSFGNHPAYLALQQDGYELPAPELVVPGDAHPARTLIDVNRITLAVQNPTPTTPSAPGAVTIEAGRQMSTRAPRTAILPHGPGARNGKYLLSGRVLWRCGAPCAAVAVNPLPVRVRTSLVR